MNQMHSNQGMGCLLHRKLHVSLFASLQGSPSQGTHRGTGCTSALEHTQLSPSIPDPNNKTWPTHMYKLKWRELTPTGTLLVQYFTDRVPGGSDDKKSVCIAGDPGSTPGLRKSPGEGNGNPLQYSCLENPLDRGACQTPMESQIWT